MSRQSYRVNGLEVQSGRKVEVFVFATSIEEALSKARSQGMEVDTISLYEGEERKQEVHRNTEATAFSLPPDKPLPPVETNNHRWRFVSLIVLALIISPFLPYISLLAGAVLALSFIGLFFERTSKYCRALFKLDYDKPWRSLGRLVAYGSITCLLILFGLAGLASQYEQRQEAERQAKLKADQAAKVAKANAQVLSIAERAQSAWQSGDIILAKSLAAEAEGVKDANDHAPLSALVKNIANAECRVYTDAAVKAAEVGDVATAKQEATKAVNVANATEVGTAAHLLKQIEMLEDEDSIELLNAMTDASDEDFALLKKGEALPSQLTTGYAALDETVLARAKKLAPKAAEEREDRKKQEAERQKIKAAADEFLLKGKGAKVPYDKWKVLGMPVTLEGTNNKYWVAYVEPVDISFVSLKASDEILYVARGRETAGEFLKNQEAERDKITSKHFSAWDGHHRGLTKVIKATMKNPDSYEHVETSYWDMGDHLVVQTTFRGTNSFGGIVPNTIKAKVDLDGNVLEVIE